MSSIYDKLPYGEVQTEMSSASFERLRTLLTNPEYEPIEDEIAVETVTAITMSDSGLSLEVQSQLEVFVPVFSNVGQVLVEHDRLPDYLLDTLSKLVEVADSERVKAVDGQNQMALPYEYIKEIASARWSAAEKERVTGKTFDVVSVYIPGIGNISVHMEYVTETERWKLGYYFEEKREYEQCGKHLYRVVDGTLFSDPVGSKEEEPNLVDGVYLPSRLDPVTLQERTAA